MKTTTNSKKYRIRNWKQYNKALVKRGNVTLWLDQAATECWYAQTHSKKKGHPQLYTDNTITCGLTLQAVFHLPLRATQGFLSSLLSLLGLSSLQAPDYSTLSRRKKGLNIELPYKTNQGSIDIVFDSTGLKVYGEGEWKVRQHGYTKRRTWRKVHLALDPKNHIIEAVLLTTNAYKDNQVIEPLLDQVQADIDNGYGDGGYDANNCYEVLAKRGAKAHISPRRNAKQSKRGNGSDELSFIDDRDNNIHMIQKLGRKAWKQQSGYHKRSLIETAMFRLKKIFGGVLSSRTLLNQAAETLIRCRALNIMSTLGMPASVRV